MERKIKPFNINLMDSAVYMISSVIFYFIFICDFKRGVWVNEMLEEICFSIFYLMVGMGGLFFMYYFIKKEEEKILRIYGEDLVKELSEKLKMWENEKRKLNFKIWYHWKRLKKYEKIRWVVIFFFVILVIFFFREKFFFLFQFHHLSYKLYSFHLIIYFFIFFSLVLSNILKREVNKSDFIFYLMMDKLMSEGSYIFIRSKDFKNFFRWEGFSYFFLIFLVYLFFSPASILVVNKSYFVFSLKFFLLLGLLFLIYFLGELYERYRLIFKMIKDFYESCGV